MLRAGVPLPLLTLDSVGPTLMALGTPEQKERILSGILRGEVHFSIGYTEPSAGTDLAALRTQAGRDGDEHDARSQTIFTSGGVTNEARRDIIAMVGLGMPRAPR